MIQECKNPIIEGDFKWISVSNCECTEQLHRLNIMEHKWRKLFGYYKPYKGLLWSDMFFAIMGAGVTLVIPLIVRYITNEVVYLPGNEPLHQILKLGALMLGLVVLEFICNFYIAYQGHIMGASIEHDMRNEIFSHYQKLSFTFFNNQKVGQLLSRVTTDLFDISELLHHGPEDLVISLIKFIGSFIILFSINQKLTLVAFAFVPVMAVYAFYFNTRMKKAFKENRAKIADINSQIEDSLSGIRVVKSFANEDVEMNKFRRGNSRFVESKKKSYWYMGGYNSGLGALTTMVTIAVLAVGAVMITNKTMAVADLITFFLYINNFTEPVKKLINFTEQFQNGYAGYERFLEILDVEPDIADAPGAVELEEVKGDIEFRDVSFQYKDGNETVLSHINLKVSAGDYLAVVGSSGGGKTTMCSLIPRFYDVAKGQILLDGRDVRSIQLKSLRDHIGIVQQDVYLFAENIMENIRYGRPDATDEEVVEAAKRANAHDFIAVLPDGYYTDIGQRGVKLSGGQKQRLSIARVFLKNPPILIFDEATSALDNESEKIVQNSLEELAKNRTTFVIAHRLTTIRNAQRILVLTEKGIEEEGTHKELLERNGAYAALYRQ
jgi:ATP-binding cassette subfamily B protein